MPRDDALVARLVVELIVRLWEPSPRPDRSSVVAEVHAAGRPSTMHTVPPKLSSVTLNVKEAAPTAS